MYLPIKLIAVLLLVKFTRIAFPQINTFINTSLTECNRDHHEDLSSTPDQDTQHHTLPGWPEHVSVHQLPTKLFLWVLLCVGY